MSPFRFALPLALASTVLSSDASAQFSTAASRKLAPLPSVPAATPTSTQALVALGSDDCSSAAVANAISGVGTFALDTTGATTGTPQPGCITMNRDVWFYWTATTSGLATIGTCGGVTADSTLAVWSDGIPAGTCPTSVLACIDDFCGLQSQVSLTVTAGQSYFLHFGAFGPGATYAGIFSISVAAPATPDECSTPTAISGLGTFAFDNTAATTGSEGQAEATCSFFGTTGIANDIWYSWTAPATGTAELSACAGSSIDTKVAVYGGSGCPTSAAIACNDDFCGLLSQLSFACVGGQTYTIQFGSYPGSLAGSGTFAIDMPNPSIGCQIDDGTSESTVGLTAGGDLVELQLFNGVGLTSVSSISVAYGTGMFPDPTLNGLPVTVAIWEDPNDDGLPNDLVLLATAPSTIAAEGTDTFIQADLPAPVTVSGRYFVGVAITHAAFQFPGAIDQGQPSSGRSWIAGTNVPGTIDLANIGSAPIAPIELDGAGIPGVWLVRADCAPITGAAVCAGTAATCPCGNGGTSGNGCANASNAAGARLQATGEASIATDTLRLGVSGMPAGTTASSCSFVQASTLGAGVVFGDGVLCLSGAMIRLGTRPLVNGSASLGSGNPGDPAISVAGLVTAPGTRHYQVVYRNSVPFCTPATFNATNGVTIVWN